MSTRTKQPSYDADAVKRGVSVRTYLRDAGVRICGNRCVATWRGGDGLTCSIYEANGENAVWDHKDDARLNVIDLCMRIEGRDFASAKIALAERYGIPPIENACRTPPKRTKPSAPPCWSRVAWLVIHADEADAVRDARGTITDSDREGVRLVSEVFATIPDIDLDGAITIAAYYYEKENA